MKFIKETNVFHKITLALLMSIIASLALADTEGSAIGSDTRIRTVVFDPNRVVSIRGAFGLTAAIEFAEDELIKTVSIGDSVAWQVVPNNNILFLKPQENRPQTNLIVITNRRTYAFNLKAIKTENLNDPRLTYRVKFHYPDDEMRRLADLNKREQVAKEEMHRRETAAVVPQPHVNMPVRAKSPAEWNYKYSFKGSKQAAPLQMLDDGEFTYIRFTNYENTPAIFLVDSDKKETLLNFRREGEWLVIERIAHQFTFRANNNADIACVFNDAYPVRPISALSEVDHAPTSTDSDNEVSHD